MRIRAFVEVEVRSADGTEVLPSRVDGIMDGLRKYVAYGVHALADNCDADADIKYTVIETGTDTVTEKEVKE